ncbi:hypothetical protein GCM10020358_24340 [Amorphoplanes nipponensis]
MVRLMGHAGADAEVALRTADEIARDLERDPLVGTARLLVASGNATVDELITRYDEVGWQVARWRGGAQRARSWPPRRDRRAAGPAPPVRTAR